MPGWKPISLGLIVLVIILAGITAVTLSAPPKLIEKTVVRTEEKLTTVTTTVTATPPPPKVEEIAYGLSSAKSVSWLAFYVADEVGYFRELGIKVKEVVLEGESVVTALLAGETQFSMTTVPLMNSVLRGAEVRILTYTMKAAPNTIVSRPDLKTAKDLEGKKFGTDSYADRGYVVTQTFSEKMGVKFEMIPFGNTPARVAAIESGRVDAVWVSASAGLILGSKGFNILSTDAEILPSPSFMVGVHKSTIEKRPDLVEKVVKAIGKAVAYIRTVPGGTQAIITKRAGLPADLAKVYYEKFWNAYTFDFDSKAMETFIKDHANYLKIPPKTLEDITDLKFYRKAVSEGL